VSRPPLSRRRLTAMVFGAVPMPILMCVLMGELERGGPRPWPCPPLPPPPCCLPTSMGDGDGGEEEEDRDGGGGDPLWPLP
jgi:hypothetical protein